MEGQGLDHIAAVAIAFSTHSLAAREAAVLFRCGRGLSQPFLDLGEFHVSRLLL